MAAFELARMKAERFASLVRKLNRQTQQSLDGDASIAKLVAGKAFAAEGFLGGFLLG